MKRTFITLAALAVSLTAVTAQAVTQIPPANKWSSSLTEPNPAGGADFHITKTSSASVSVSTSTLTVQIKLAGVTDGVGGPLVTQSGNTLQVNLRYHGTVHVLTFNVDLVGGKNDLKVSKHATDISTLPGGPVLPGESIQVLDVKCLQGGSGPGATNNFCTPGLTAK